MPGKPTTGVHIGRVWKTTLQGRNSLNGSRYSITVIGEMVRVDPDKTIWDVIHAVAETVRGLTPEMEIPDSIQLTIFPPGEVIKSEIKKS